MPYRLGKRHRTEQILWVTRLRPVGSTRSYLRRLKRYSVSAAQMTDTCPVSLKRSHPVEWGQPRSDLRHLTVKTLPGVGSAGYRHVSLSKVSTSFSSSVSLKLGCNPQVAQVGEALILAASMSHVIRLYSVSFYGRQQRLVCTYTWHDDWHGRFKIHV